MSLNNNFINVTFTQNGVKTKNKINGSLTNDTLCVVSPSTFGKAFVPTHLVNPNRITNTDNPENNTLTSMRGNLRQNVYGHTYDNLIKHTPNQGYPALENWFNGGGQDAVHIRVLGIGDGIRNLDGSWKNAGFELSEINKKMSFVISQYKDGVNDYYKELLSLDDDSDIDNHYFITSQIITASLNQLSVNSFDNTLSGKQIRFSTSPSQNVLTRLFINIEKHSNLNFLNFQDTEKDFYYLINPLVSASSTEECDVKIKTFSTNDERFNSFRSVYRTAKTPWVTSQPLDRTGLGDNRENIHERVSDLFRFHALDDGEIGNRFRIKINPKTLGNKDKQTFSTFDVIVFEYDPRNNTFKKLESFENISLDSSSKDYIGFKIGSKYEHYDIENKKIIVENEAYGNASEFIRVEINEDIEFKKIKNIESLVPCGFRSYPRLNLDENDFQDQLDNDNNKHVYYLPPKVVIDKNKENFGSILTGIDNSWGIQFYRARLIRDKEFILPVIRTDDNTIFQDNSGSFVSPHYFHTKYINDSFHDETKNLSVTEDNYLNSFFHLEKIAFNNNNNIFKYRPSGRASSLSEGSSYISIKRGGENFQVFDEQGNVKDAFENKLSFDFFTFGGFDGVNCFNFEESMLTDYSLNEEYYSKGLKSSGPIYQAYKTAIDQVMSYENCNGDIIVTPDISLIELQRYVIDKCEEIKRFIHVTDASGIYYYFTNNHLLDDDNDAEITNSTKKYILDVNDLVSKLGPSYVLNHISLTAHSFNSYRLLMKNIISLSMSHNITSRYYFPILAESVKLVDNVQHYRSSVSEICRFLPERYNTISEDISVIGTTYTDCFSEDVLGDSNNSSQTKELFSKNLRNNLLNGITKNNNIDTLTSNLTAFGREYSVFKELELVRRIQLVKKLVMISIFTDESFIAGTVFFSNSSNYNNIYQLLNIQLNILLEDIKSSGLISGYKVNIDPNFMQNKPREVLENKLSGNIIIQFGTSDIISLSLDNILSELSFLQENTLNESGYNSVEIRSN